jgi:hypothetical protein
MVYPSSVKFDRDGQADERALPRTTVDVKHAPQGKRALTHAEQAHGFELAGRLGVKATTVVAYAGLQFIVEKPEGDIDLAGVRVT